MQQQALFPPPPAYYTRFSAQPDGSAEHPLPPDPPPLPPADGIYTIFGEMHGTTPVLPTIGKTFYTTNPDGSIDIKGELLRLHKELIAAFMLLLGTLIENPTMYGRAVQKVGTVLTNMQRLINALRPHQARYSLVGGLEKEVGDMRRAIEDLKEKEEGGRKVLDEFWGTVRDGQKERERERESSGKAQQLGAV